MKASDSQNQSSGIEVERVSSLDQLLGLRSEWDRLQDAGAWKHVLLDHRWVAAWWKHFGADKEQHTLLLRRGGELVGIAPFAISSGLEAFPAKDAQFKLIDDYEYLRVPRWRRFVPIRRVTFPLNLACHNERSHMLLREESSALYEAVLQYWRDRQELWDLLVLDGVPEESPQLEGLREAGTKLGFGVLPTGRTLGLYGAELGSSIEDFLRSRSRHFRKRHNAELRDNSAAGCIEFDEYRGEQVQAGLRVLFDLESKSWKSKARTDREVQMPMSDRIRGFFTEVACAFAETDGLTILVMKLDGQPMAALASLTRQQVRLTLVTYMDDAYRGRVTSASLFREFLERAIDEGVTRVDYNGCTINAQKVSNVQTNYRRLYLHHGGAYSRLLGSAKASATWLSRTVRAMRSKGDR